MKKLMKSIIAAIAGVLGIRHFKVLSGPAKGSILALRFKEESLLGWAKYN